MKVYVLRVEISDQYGKEEIRGVFNTEKAADDEGKENYKDRRYWVEEIEVRK